MAAKEQETKACTALANFFSFPFPLLSAKLTFASDLPVANRLTCVTSARAAVIAVCVICAAFPKSLSEDRSSSPLSLSPALIESL